MKDDLIYEINNSEKNYEYFGLCAFFLPNFSEKTQNKYTGIILLNISETLRSEGEFLKKEREEEQKLKNIIENKEYLLYLD
jgi:hypothetical protein